MLAAHAGSTRSKAAAKMTRVDERKRVPAQPKNHRPMTMIKRAWKRWLLTRNPANITGYGQMGTGGAGASGTAERLFQSDAVAGWWKVEPAVLLNRSPTTATRDSV